MDSYRCHFQTHNHFSDNIIDVDRLNVWKYPEICPQKSKFGRIFAFLLAEESIGRSKIVPLLKFDFLDNLGMFFKNIWCA